MKKTVEILDKSALTFRQLEGFVKHAKATGTTGDELMQARISMGGRLRGISVAVDLVPWAEIDNAGD